MLINSSKETPIPLVKVFIIGVASYSELECYQVPLMLENFHFHLCL